MVSAQNASQVGQNRESIGAPGRHLVYELAKPQVLFQGLVEPMAGYARRLGETPPLTREFDRQAECTSATLLWTAIGMGRPELRISRVDMPTHTCTSG